jgi:hypothetical protein
MYESQLSFSAAEREYLTAHLESVLKEKRIEEHRTRSPGYREHVLQEEAIIAGLLDKLRTPTAAPAETA